MATSGTFGYLPTLDDLIVEAWERCGKAGEVLTGDVARSARRSIQLMLLDWTNRGMNLWQVQAMPMTLAAGIATVTLAASVVDVVNAYVTLQGSDRVLGAIGRDDYIGMPNKLTLGPPSQYWVERLTPAPVLHFYPVPDLTYSAVVYAMIQPQDVTNLMQTADAPILWSEAIAAGLAARLAVKFADGARAQVLNGLAQEAFTLAAGEDRERVALRIEPAGWC